MSLKSPLIFYTFASAWLAIPAASLSADTELHIQPERIEQHIMELSAFGKNPKGGISHSPEEFTPTQDMANGAAVLLRTLLAIDAGALER